MGWGALLTADRGRGAWASWAGCVPPKCSSSLSFVEQMSFWLKGRHLGGEALTANLGGEQTHVV